MRGALDRVRLLRTALQQASLAATVPDVGIIITPALDRTLRRSQEVLLIHSKASVPANVVQDSPQYTLTCLRGVDNNLLASCSQILRLALWT